jgi:peptidoglycan-associated lipoprotein
MMKVNGVSEGQLDIVSYGEEKPAAFGSDEAAWEQNRRVVISYQGK